MDKVSFNWKKLLINSTYGISGLSQNEYERKLNNIKKIKRSKRIKELMNLSSMNSSMISKIYPLPTNKL